MQVAHKVYHLFTGTTTTTSPITQKQEVKADLHLAQSFALGWGLSHVVGWVSQPLRTLLAPLGVNTIFNDSDRLSCISYVVPLQKWRREAEEALGLAVPSSSDSRLLPFSSAGDCGVLGPTTSIPNAMAYSLLIQGMNTTLQGLVQAGVNKTWTTLTGEQGKGKRFLGRVTAIATAALIATTVHTAAYGRGPHKGIFDYGDLMAELFYRMVIGVAGEISGMPGFASASAVMMPLELRGVTL